MTIAYFLKVCLGKDVENIETNNFSFILINISHIYFHHFLTSAYYSRDRIFNNNFPSASMNSSILPADENYNVITLQIVDSEMDEEPVNLAWWVTKSICFVVNNRELHKIYIIFIQVTFLFQSYYLDVT